MSPTLNDASSEPLHASHGRRARIALFALLLLTGGLAAGILFVKFKLETLREAIEKEAITRIGVRLDGGTVKVNGLRGLRIDNFRATFRVPLGPDVSIAVPRALVDIDLADLLSGRMTIDQVNIDEAEIRLSRGEGGKWFNPENQRGHSLTKGISFRLKGKNCTLSILGGAGGITARMVELDLDLAKLADSRDLLANVSGRIEGGSKSRFNAKLRFATMEDFDLRLGSETLSAQDINAFLPIPGHFLHTGAITPKVQVNGYPDQNLVLSIEMGFENLLLRGQPPSLRAATGKLTALSNYNLRDQVLTLATARVDSDQFSGELEGGVQFGGPLPHFDLLLKAEELPEMAPLAYELPVKLERYGEVEVDLDAPNAIELRLEGTPESPRISVEARLPGGTFKFKPRDARFPALDFTLGAILLEWDAQSATPKGSIEITDGTLSYEEYDLRCENLRGRLLLEGGTLRLDPLNGRIGANPLVVQATYDLTENTLGFEVNGILPEVEKTPFPGMIAKADFSGPVGLDCRGVIKDGLLSFDASLDATQAWFELDWWFEKPAGTGLGIEGLHVDYRPGKTLDVTVKKIRIDTTVLEAELHGVRSGGKWRIESITATAPSFEIPAIGSCLRIPYAVTGGVCRNFAFSFVNPADAEGITLTLSGDIDAITLRPRQSEVVAEIKEARFHAVWEGTGAERAGHLKVHAASGDVPPLDSGWLRAMRPPHPQLDEKYPRIRRRWDYEITADTLRMPPWDGRGFALRGWNDAETLELTAFGAEIGAGRLDGSYRAERGDNLATFTAVWNEIPAAMLLKYLDFPELLTGQISGSIEYTLDRDDPATLRGTGSFGISSGQFSADYLFKKFEEQLSADFSSLPGSLKFSRFGADIELEGDIVKTGNLELKAEALRITGAGQFTVDGDLDYTLNVALPPETAERIPVLASNINLQGYKIAQRDVELGFKVTGPFFSPTAEVTTLPSLGDTLLVGVGEVGKEVGKVIDTPRQIIMDLFRIMGGIVKSPSRDGNRGNGREIRGGGV